MHITCLSERPNSLSITTLGLFLRKKIILLTFLIRREAGKKRIHEMPLFREYEYTRISLHSMFSIASRSEVKIVEFYSSEGAPKLPQAMNEAFRLKSMSPEEFEKDWVRTLQL